MDLNIIIVILFIPIIILTFATLYHFKKLITKINGINANNLKAKINKSFAAGDLLLEVFFPKKYSKKYPNEFKKARFLVIPLIILFVPTLAMISYLVFMPLFIKKEFGMLILILGFILLSLIARMLLSKYARK